MRCFCLHFSINLLQFDRKQTGFGKEQSEKRILEFQIHIEPINILQYHQQERKRTYFLKNIILSNLLTERALKQKHTMCMCTKYLLVYFSVPICSLCDTHISCYYISL